MSYLVLARKYRPQTFEEIVGQEHVTRTLASAIAAGRVHHAFLFTGARGVGKTTAARILAKCLSCVNAPTATPCNVCEACVEITGGTSVDVQEIDGASNNSVEDVRTLRESIRYLPVRGKRKVYIVDEVHMLSTAAFNALLKTLEEPPAHALFIFATTEVHKVPITILSRVQRYDFKLVPSARIAQHLASVLKDEGVTADPAALALIAREAAGSVRDSLSLCEQVLATAAGRPLDEVLAAEALGVADRGLIADLGRAVLARDAAAALGLLGAACDRAYDMKHLAEVFLAHLRDLVVARIVPDPSPLIDAPASELAALQQTAKAAPNGLLELLFDRFAHVAENAAESPLPRYVIEVGLCELCRVEPLEPVSQLIDRMEQMESRLGGGAVSAPRPSRADDVRPSPSPRPAPSTSPSASASPPPRPHPNAPPPTAPKTTGPKPTSWPALAQAIADRRPRLAFLMTAEEIHFDENSAAIAFPGAYEAEQAQELLSDITALVRDILGRPMKIEVRAGSGGAPSVFAAQEQAARDEVDRKRKEALDHPARKLVRGAFGDDVAFKEPEVE